MHLSETAGFASDSADRPCLVGFCLLIIGKYSGVSRGTFCRRDLARANTLLQIARYMAMALTARNAFRRWEHGSQETLRAQSPAPPVRCRPVPR